MITREDAQVRLIEKAQRDPEFKRMLVSNPKSAVEAELGMKLSSNTQVKVLEESPNSLYLVIPVDPATLELELSDEQLAGISAGSEGDSGMISC